jgi:hypothetical protein
MSQQVRFSHYMSLNGTSYVPLDVASLSDDDAASVVSAGQGVYVSGQPLSLQRNTLRSDTLNLLDVEQENVPWWAANSATIAMTSGLARFSMFTARRTMSVANLRFLSGGTAAGATPSLVKFGLYTVDLSSARAIVTLTRVAVTASDTALFAAANTAYSKALTAAYTVQEGARYAVAALVVTAAAAPTVQGVTGGAVQTGPWYAAQVAAQADLGASYAVGALTNSASAPYVTVA